MRDQIFKMNKVIGSLPGVNHTSASQAALLPPTNPSSVVNEKHSEIVTRQSNVSTNVDTKVNNPSTIVASPSLPVN